MDWGTCKTSNLFLVILKSTAREIPNLRVSPLAAVVTHKARTIRGLSFDEQTSEKRGRLKRDNNPDNVPNACALWRCPSFSPNS